MEIPFDGGDFSIRDVLRRLSFQEDWGVFTDELPGYTWDFGNFTLEAKQLTGLYLQPEFSFSGLLQDARSLTSVSFSVPLMVESFEQGTAWIADALDRQRVKPRTSPAWLDQGRQWQGLLPWVRRLRAYEAAPKCVVDRDWMRVAARRFRAIAPRVEVDALVMLSFDGTHMSIAVAGSQVDMMADGTAWPEEYFITFGDLLLPLQRLMRPAICVKIWEGQVHFGNRCLQLASDTGID